MRLLQLAASVAVFTTLVTSRALLSSDLTFRDVTVARNLDVVLHDAFSLLGDEPVFAATAADSKWDQAVRSGGNLWAGMHSDDRKASFLFRTDPHTHDPTIQSVQSSHDGDMRQDFKKWGYNEDEAEIAKIDRECDFAIYHKIKRAFDELGIKTESKANNGPNECVQLDHQGGPSVIRDKEDKLPPIDEQKYIDASCGKEYRITGATFQFGLNAKDGMITLINVISPGYCAERLWKRKPSSEELPHIRSISDVAWGFWNRAGNVKNIKYLMVTMIMNEETRSLIRQAHETLEPKRSETAVWPGYDFGMGTPAGQALLGSPVGRWAGYFLMQHKTQLGGNRFISKVRVFKPDVGSLPYMLFYADGVAANNAREKAEEIYIIKRSNNGKNILREHIFRVEVRGVALRTMSERADVE